MAKETNRLTVANSEGAMPSGQSSRRKTTAPLKQKLRTSGPRRSTRSRRPSSVWCMLGGSFFLPAFLLLLLSGCSAVPTGCNSSIDLVFALDTSESLRDYDPPGRPLHAWQTLKDFAKVVVQNLPVNPYETKVAAVRFSSYAELVFDLDHYPNSINVQDGIAKMEHVGGNTNTADALIKARYEFLRGSRGSSRKVIVLMTDGLSNVLPYRTLEEARVAKEDDGVEIFTVGITEYIDKDELLVISSQPKETHFFHAKTFDELDGIWEKLVHRICGVPDPVPTPPPPLTPEDCKIAGCTDCRTEYTCETCATGLHYDTSRRECTPCMEFCEVCRSRDMCDRCHIGWYWEPLLRMCKECEVQADIALLIDNSGSIRDKNPEDESYDNYQLLKDFIKHLLDRLDIGPDTTRVAAIRYSTSAQLEFNLDEHQTREEIKYRIDSMGYGGGHTNTSGGLRLMRNKIFVEKRGDRPGVRNVGIVITDGESTKDANLTIPEANLAKKDNITLFVVGVTDEINEVELKAIASDPDDEHYFNQTEIKLLDNIILQLIKHVCAPENPASNIVHASRGQPGNSNRKRRDASSAYSWRRHERAISLHITIVVIIQFLSFSFKFP